MLINKYIGETEKNLGDLLDESANSTVILFFDEADDFLGKRTQVRNAYDGYANLK